MCKPDRKTLKKKKRTTEGEKALKTFLSFIWCGDGKYYHNPNFPGALCQYLYTWGYCYLNKQDS